MKPAIEKEVEKHTVAQAGEGFIDLEPVQGTCYQIGRIFQRSWIQTVRHPMMMKNRFMNILITTLIFGGIFFNAGKDNRPEPGSLVSSLDLETYLFSLQGVCFTNITSMIMNGIFSIALLCNHPLTQSPSKGKSTSRRSPPKHTVPSPISSGRRSLRSPWPSSSPFSIQP